MADANKQPLAPEENQLFPGETKAVTTEENKAVPQKKKVVFDEKKNAPPVEKYKLEKEYLAMEFDVDKKYMFELAVENLERELPVIGIINNKARQEPHKRFKPYQNIVLTSQIIWQGQRRTLRYYDGCTTIFADEQTKDKDEIAEFRNQTRPRHFNDGKFGCFGDEKMLLLYLNICSWNANSPFRTRNADAIFVSVDNAKLATAETLKLDETERALELAKNASEKKMMIHAAYLEIPLEDYDSGNPYTPNEIRAKYRKRALMDSTSFLESYGNEKIEIKYYINEALKKGLINSKENANKAAWNSGRVICDISGLKSTEGIAEKLFEFSQLEEGEEFLIQLKALLQ